ncbi:fumarylacetoacetate hydrolase family protein [Filibacter tadaridae]|uniref:Homoprotocatechuate catabolism bifunctional isomerase/decarboxylase n=1 Tax=Filibacter tadaridae TaxID=2483811 RepID=A0A3P5X563_9BACL|nr:fumarylacetoacetate hydrolase family protein [Filibacter tadaridae]VDC29632.1 Homoprotocatechuate catabolism bifunctional isomerase/decarboxylase [Filibacter tadaridae]
MTKAKIKAVGSNELQTVEVNIKTNTIFMNDNAIHASDLQLFNPINGTVFGTLLNYKGELELLGGAVHEKPYQSPPIAPVLYIKPANTFNHFGAEILMPTGMDKLKIGAALGLVIGKRASEIDEATAMDYIAGYTIVNDVSVPHESIFRPAVQHNARDGFCSMGPWIIDYHEVEDPDDLTIRVFINEKLQQENSTSNLIRPISRLLADVTEFMTLSPGDVLLVGVPEHAPLAYVEDTIRIEIEGIGSLENIVVAEMDIGRRNVI